MIIQKNKVWGRPRELVMKVFIFMVFFYNINNNNHFMTDCLGEGPCSNPKECIKIGDIITLKLQIRLLRATLWMVPYLIF